MGVGCCLGLVGLMGVLFLFCGYGWVCDCGSFGGWVCGLFGGGLVGCL